jgi:hypothetical protein
MRLAIAMGMVLAALAGCDGGAPMGQPARLATLAFDAPAGWHGVQSDRPGLATVVWTPDDNTRKESVTVIRTEQSPVVAAAGTPVLEDALTRAQGSLFAAKVGEAQHVTTGRGLAGVRIELDYVPPGQTAHYHRAHAVVAIGTTLVHVLYTAAEPDQDLAAFSMVLNTLRAEEVRS